MSSLLSVDINPIDVSNDKDVVKLADARFYAALGDNFSDALVSVFIASARMKLERYTALIFIPSNIKAKYVQYGCGDQIELAYINGLVKDSLKIDDGSDTGAALPNDMVLKGYGSQLYLDTTQQEVNLMYQAGYETNNAPEIVKQAVLKQVTWDTMHFGDEGLPDVCPEAKNLLSQFRAFIWL